MRLILGIAAFCAFGLLVIQAWDGVSVRPSEPNLTDVGPRVIEALDPPHKGDQSDLVSPSRTPTQAEPDASARMEPTLIELLDRPAALRDAFYNGVRRADYTDEQWQRIRDTVARFNVDEAARGQIAGYLDRYVDLGFDERLTKLAAEGRDSESVQRLRQLVETETLELNDGARRLAPMLNEWYERGVQMGALRVLEREEYEKYEAEEWGRERNGLRSIVVAAPSGDGLRYVLRLDSGEHPELDRELAQLKLRFERAKKQLRKGIAALEKR